MLRNQSGSMKITDPFFTSQTLKYMNEVEMENYKF